MKEYTEVQGFRQWWLWVLLLGLLLFFLYAFLQQVFLGKPVGDNPMNNWALGFTIVFMFALILSLGLLQLRTHISKETITIRFGPFGTHQFAWNQIRKARIIHYGFVGYGYRITKNHGTVYNTGGNRGLELVLKNGDKITIGTQRPEQLKQFLKALGKLK